jgi:hypothetical protein
MGLIWLPEGEQGEQKIILLWCWMGYGAGWGAEDNNVFIFGRMMWVRWAMDLPGTPTETLQPSEATA